MLLFVAAMLLLPLVLVILYFLCVRRVLTATVKTKAAIISATNRATSSICTYAMRFSISSGADDALHGAISMRNP